MKNELLLLYITDRKAINKIEMFYLDKENNILKISNKISYNKYYRVRKIKDKETNDLEDILKKTEKIIIKIILYKRLVVLAVIPKLSFDEENIIIISISSKYMFKYFKENGSENTFKYIESYNPEKHNDDFKKKYSIGTFNVNKNGEEITLQVSETNMNIDEVVELKNYYDFLINEKDEGLFELYKYELKSMTQKIENIVIS